MESERRKSRSCSVSSNPSAGLLPLAPTKKIPVSAPRLRISWTASREASVALSDSSMARSSFSISRSAGRSCVMDLTIAHCLPVASDDASREWRFLGSTPRERLGKLTLREDVWRLPTGIEKTYPILHVGLTVGVVPFVDAAHVLLVRQFRHLLRADSW